MYNRLVRLSTVMALMICLTLLLNTKTAAIEPYVEKTKKDCMECHIDKYYPAGDFFKAETETKWHYQWWIFSIGFFIFSCGVMAKLYMWNIGRGKIFSEKIEWKRFLDFLFFEVIFQRKIFKASYLRWFIFFSESMGFLMLFLFFLVLVLTRFIFKIDFFISGAGGLALDFMLDFIGLLILCGTVVSFVRRCLKKNNLITEREDIVAVLFLFFIVLTGFFLEAFRLAVLPFSFESYFSFVGFGMASIIRNIDLPWTVIRYYTWIIHAIIVLIFLAYIPFSKFIHFMTCPVSTLAMSSDPQG